MEFLRDCRGLRQIAAAAAKRCGHCLMLCPWRNLLWRLMFCTACPRIAGGFCLRLEEKQAAGKPGWIPYSVLRIQFRHFLSFNIGIKHFL